MNYEEALAWLSGERSTTNWLEEPICSQTDAAMTQQAYWIVRAHNEGLVEESSWRCAGCGELTDRSHYRQGADGVMFHASADAPESDETNQPQNFSR